MNVPFDVSYGVVNNLVNKLSVQSLIRFQCIREHFSAGVNVVLDVFLSRLLPATINDGDSNLAASFFKCPGLHRKADALKHEPR